MLNLKIHMHEILNNNFRLEFPKLNKWIVNLKGSNLHENYMYIVQTVVTFLNQVQLHLFVGGLMPYLRYLCLLGYSGIQHILCCVICSARLRLVSCVPNVASVCGLSLLFSLTCIFYSLTWLMYLGN
jgi:hypothetical protein